MRSYQGVLSCGLVEPAVTGGRQVSKTGHPHLLDAVAVSDQCRHATLDEADPDKFGIERFTWVIAHGPGGERPDGARMSRHHDRLARGLGLDGEDARPEPAHA